MNSKTTPLVSICCNTYNHVKYIRDAIEGFLMQKTDFPFEILIHDDASTDGTAEIIRGYETKYHHIIKPIYQTENQYSKGIKISATYNFPRAKGKYIALCEGDDYWIDPLKLQKQVDFLEANPDCSICFHASKHIKDNVTNMFYTHRPKKIPKNNKFEIKHAILGGGGFMATNSMLFLRKHILELPEWMNKTPVGDLPLMLVVASKGYIGYLDDIMSVYRIMTENSWSSTMQDKQKRVRHHYAMLEMWDNFDQWSDKKYHKYVLMKKFKNKIYFLKGKIRQLVR